MTYDDVPQFPLARYVFPIERLEHWIARQRDRIWSVDEAEKATGVVARRDMISRMLCRGDIEYIDGPSPHGGYASVAGRYRGLPRILEAVEDTVKADAEHQEKLQGVHKMFLTEFRPVLDHEMLCPFEGDISGWTVAEGVLRVGVGLHPGTYDIMVCNKPCTEKPRGCVRLALTLPGLPSGKRSSGNTVLHPDLVDPETVVLGEPLTKTWGSDCWHHPDGTRDKYNLPWQTDKEGYVPERHMEVGCASVRDALLAVFEAQAVLVQEYTREEGETPCDLGPQAGPEQTP